MTVWSIKESSTKELARTIKPFEYEITRSGVKCWDHWEKSTNISKKLCRSARTPEAFPDLRFASY